MQLVTSEKHPFRWAGSLLQVESLIPQAVLEELKITRKSDILVNHQESLLLETTHTCWKAEEAGR
jgi:hypothetical protein